MNAGQSLVGGDALLQPVDQTFQVTGVLVADFRDSYAESGGKILGFFATGFHDSGHHDRAGDRLIVVVDLQSELATHLNRVDMRDSGVQEETVCTQVSGPKDVLPVALAADLDEGIYLDPLVSALIFYFTHRSIIGQA